MYVVSCARILARCHIQIVYNHDDSSSQIDLPRNEMQAQRLLPLLLLYARSCWCPPSTRTLPGCVPVHLAASLCWRPLFEWHLNLCIHPNLVRLIVRTAGAAICCCSVSPDRTSHSIGDGIMRWLHYALAARARAAAAGAADATRINNEFDFEFIRNSKTELAQVVNEIGISVLGFGL